MATPNAPSLWVLQTPTLDTCFHTPFPPAAWEAGVKACTVPPHSPSHRSAWPAAPCRHCTPCTCCRHSGSSAGAPHAGLKRESSLWKYTPQPGCQSLPSYLRWTGERRKKEAGRSITGHASVHFVIQRFVPGRPNTSII